MAIAIAIWFQNSPVLQVPPPSLLILQPVQLCPSAGKQSLQLPDHHHSLGLLAWRETSEGLALHSLTATWTQSGTSACIFSLS